MKRFNLVLIHNSAGVFELFEINMLLPAISISSSLAEFTR